MTCDQINTRAWCVLFALTYNSVFYKIKIDAVKILMSPTHCTQTHPCAQK